MYKKGLALKVVEVVEIDIKGSKRRERIKAENLA